jgi:hypothetical protein
MADAIDQLAGSAPRHEVEQDTQHSSSGIVINQVVLGGGSGQARRLLPPWSASDRCSRQQVITDVLGKRGELLDLSSPPIAVRSPIRFAVAGVQVAEKLGRSLFVAPVAN